jgi:hypothetical protein
LTSCNSTLEEGRVEVLDTVLEERESLRLVVIDEFDRLDLDLAEVVDGGLDFWNFGAIMSL